MLFSMSLKSHIHGPELFFQAFHPLLPPDEFLLRKLRPLDLKKKLWLFDLLPFTVKSARPFVLERKIILGAVSI
jgi:hypothetical protein